MPFFEGKRKVDTSFGLKDEHYIIRLWPFHLIELMALNAQNNRGRVQTQIYWNQSVMW